MQMLIPVSAPSRDLRAAVTASTFGTLTGYAFGDAFDRYGNLFVSDFTDNQIIKFTANGTRSVFATAGVNGPRGLAFDNAGYLYAANVTNNTIEKFNTAGVGSVFASSGLNYPIGLAFDSIGNLYAANLSNNSIEKFTSAGSPSVFASLGLNMPTFLAFTTDAGMPLPLANQVPEPTAAKLVAVALLVCRLCRRDCDTRKTLCVKINLPYVPQDCSSQEIEAHFESKLKPTGNN